MRSSTHGLARWLIITENQNLKGRGTLDLQKWLLAMDQRPELPSLQKEDSCSDNLTTEGNDQCFVFTLPDKRNICENTFPQNKFFGRDFVEFCSDLLQLHAIVSDILKLFGSNVNSCLSKYTSE